MDIWHWIVSCLILLVGLVILAFTVICFSRIDGTISYTKLQENDYLTIEVKALFGLVKTKIHVPIIQFIDIQEGIFVKSKQVDQQILSEKRQINEKKIDKKWMKRISLRAKLLFDKTVDLRGWIKQTLKLIHCSDFKWTSYVGIGDAAQTAVCTGAVWALKSSLVAFVVHSVRLETIPEISVNPLYNRTQFMTELHFKAHVKAGSIIFACLRLLNRIRKVPGGPKIWRKVLYSKST